VVLAGDTHNAWSSNLYSKYGANKNPAQAGFFMSEI